MANPLTITGYRLFTKLESSYGIGGALTGSTDALQLTERPILTVEYAADGMRTTNNGTGGAARRVAPSGKSFSTTLTTEMKGYGSAYTTVSQVPFGVPLMSCGMTASIVSGTASFTPVPQGDAEPSSCAEFYGLHQKWPLSGSRGTFKINFDSSNPATIVFDMKGLVGSESYAASLPACVWPASTVNPPSVQAATVTIGTYGATLIKGSYDHKGTVDMRLAQTAARGVAGVLTGAKRAGEFALTVEVDDFTSFNPVNLQDNATPVAVNIVWGSAVGNTFQIYSAQAIVIKATPTAQNSVGSWDLVLQTHTSTPSSDDDVAINGM